MSILRVRPPSWGWGWEWWSRRCRRRATESKVAQLAMRNGLHFCPNSTTHKLQISLSPPPQNAYTYIHRSYTLSDTKFLKPDLLWNNPNIPGWLPTFRRPVLGNFRPAVHSSIHQFILPSSGPFGIFLDENRMSRIPSQWRCGPLCHLVWWEHQIAYLVLLSSRPATVNRLSK